MGTVIFVIRVRFRIRLRFSVTFSVLVMVRVCIKNPRHYPHLANLPNRHSALCCRPVTHAQTWASYSALYRFGRLSSAFYMFDIRIRSISTAKFKRCLSFKQSLVSRVPTIPSDVLQASINNF